MWTLPASWNVCSCSSWGILTQRRKPALTLQHLRTSMSFSLLALCASPWEGLDQAHHLLHGFPTPLFHAAGWKAVSLRNNQGWTLQFHACPQRLQFPVDGLLHACHCQLFKVSSSSSIRRLSRVRLYSPRFSFLAIPCGQCWTFGARVANLSVSIPLPEFTQGHGLSGGTAALSKHGTTLRSGPLGRNVVTC